MKKIKLEDLDDCCISFSAIITGRGNKRNRDRCWIDMDKMYYHDESIPEPENKIRVAREVYKLCNSYGSRHENTYLVVLENNKTVIALGER